MESAAVRSLDVVVAAGFCAAGFLGSFVRTLFSAATVRFFLPGIRVVCIVNRIFCHNFPFLFNVLPNKKAHGSALRDVQNNLSVQFGGHPV